MSLLSVGIVGLGKMGLLHMGLLNSLRGSRVVAFAEPQTVIRKYAARFVPQFKSYANHLQMMENEKLDAVAICTPTFLHVEVVSACIERGIPFLVEKPLAVSVIESRDIARRCKGVVNLVGYACMRYTPTFQKAKELLDMGLLGEISNASGSIRSNQTLGKRNGWQYDPARSGGGALINFGSHLIYLLQWFFGRGVAVEARTRKLYSSDVEDACEGKVTFANGLTATFDVNWSIESYTAPETFLMVRGDNGSITVTSKYIQIDLKSRACGFQVGKTRLPVQDLWPSLEFELGGPEYALEDRHFIDSVISRKSTSVSVDVALQVEEIIAAAYSSAVHEGILQAVSKA